MLLTFEILHILSGHPDMQFVPVTVIGK